MKMKITGDVRAGSEFELTANATAMANGTFIAALPGEIRVTRRLRDLFDLPDDTPVVAHWHGQYRTDGFATTIQELKAKAAERSIKKQAEKAVRAKLKSKICA